MNKCQHCGFETRYNPEICPMCNKRFNNEKNAVKAI